MENIIEFARRNGATHREAQAFRDYVEAAIKAERERWAIWARAMHCADDAYGTGYYGQAEWIAAYKELRRMAGMGSGPNL